MALAGVAAVVLGLVTRQKLAPPPRPHAKLVTYLVHIHKTGGTSLCRAAKRLRLRTPREYPGWGNCNFDCQLYDLLYRRENTSGHAGPSLDLDPYDFVANEAPVVGLHSVSPRARQVVHLVVLREPCQRTRSHYLQEWSIFQPPFACNTTRCRQNRLDAGNKMVGSSFAAWFRLRRHNSFGIGCRAYEWYRDGTTTLDNFQVRVLCGPRCASIPFGGMVQADLTTALQRLERLEMVPTTLETLSSPGGWGALLQLLGSPWRRIPTMPKVAAHTMTARQRAMVPSECPSAILAHLELDRLAHELIAKQSGAALSRWQVRNGSRQ